MKHIILASSSPRRLHLLQALGFHVHTLNPNVDETPLKGEKPKELVLRLAKLKLDAIEAEDSFNRFKGFEVNIPIIAADTIVCLGDQIFGKPENAEEAVRVLKILSGQEHLVITGYCIKKGASEKMGVVETRVSFRKLREEEILAYVATKEPLDKAGSYAIQGNGASLIDHVQGSYTNVLGLPITEILACLQDRGGDEV